MTGVREPGVYRAGRRQETPHGPGYRLVLVLPDGGELPAGWVVQGGLDGKRWSTRGVDGELVVSSSYLDGQRLESVLLEHEQRLADRPEPAEPVEEPRADVTAPLGIVSDVVVRLTPAQLDALRAVAAVGVETRYGGRALTAAVAQLDAATPVLTPAMTSVLSDAVARCEVEWEEDDGERGPRFRKLEETVDRVRRVMRP